MKIETVSVHAGRAIEAGTGDASPAIHLATTFERGKDGAFPTGYSYSRADNPTRKALEACIAALEGGTEAVCFASGSAASLAVFSLLKPGDHVIAPRESYHGTAKQLREILRPQGVRCTFVDMTDAISVAPAVAQGVQLLWIETPSNPLLNVSDIRALAGLAHNHGALVCCDNTFATPIQQLPLSLGADLVMHSSTKFFGGHSDAMGGAVVVGERSELATRLRQYQETAGAVPSPFDCWLIRRSIASLPIRVRAQAQSAARIAEFLANHPKVERVFYPGLPSHTGHELARRQMSGFGAVVSFCVRGTAKTAFAVAAQMQLFIRATSLGGVESLVEHRASVEGPHGVAPDTLLRLSIGLEHTDDLIADLQQALQA